MMYFRGTVGNICLMAEARSVRMTSAFCRMNTTEMEIITYRTLQIIASKWFCLTELKLPASPVVTNEYGRSLVIMEKWVDFLLSTPTMSR